jgi:hypothetical protein
LIWRKLSTVNLHGYIPANHKKRVRRAAPGSKLLQVFVLPLNSWAALQRRERHLREIVTRINLFETTSVILRITILTREKIKRPI